ncbi:MAG: outer membrane beta-barrel protein, partial [Acidobacteriota bacterium]
PPHDPDRRDPTMDHFAPRSLTLIALALLFPTVAAAGGSWYGSLGFGFYDADADVVPLGSNIAVDPDFPQTWDLDDGTSFDLGLGYIFSDRFRLELSYAVTEFEADATNIGAGARDGFDYNVQFESDVETLMLEAYWDFRPGESFRPFIKIGAGAASSETSASIDSTTDPLFTEVLGPAGFLNAEGRYPYDEASTDDFAWLYGVGFRWLLTERLQIGVVAQRVELGDPATATDPFTDSFAAPDLTANELRLSLEIGF